MALGVTGVNRWSLADDPHAPHLPSIPRTARRNADGDIPVSRRNTFEKWLWSANPAASATSASGASVSASSPADRATRSRRR